MSTEDDYEYFKLRKAAKTYISKVFTKGAINPTPVRLVRMIQEGSDEVHLCEIEGSMCLRLTGDTRKTQITALVTQDDKKVRRLSFQTFKPRAGGWIETVEKIEFSFRSDEFGRLMNFLRRIEFINLSNQDNFKIDDISTGDGPKAIIDASDRNLVERLKRLSPQERRSVLSGLQPTLSQEEMNILLGRRQGVHCFEEQVQKRSWSEGDWQEFFNREQWVFGYGLDYRVMGIFDREMTVGSGGSDNRNKPKVDFLNTFTDYTVLVEIKKPDTPIFRQSRGGRAGTWEFSSEFSSAVSQVLEQRAEWQAFAQSGEHYSRDGSKHLSQRTRSPRSILVVGSRDEFERSTNPRDANVKQDTFELFRSEMRGIDIITYDELLERAQFIVNDKTQQ